MSFIQDGYPLSNPTSLSHFIFQRWENRRYLITACIIIIIQFIVYKYIYPFPNFLGGDSWIYIKDAQENAKEAIHPVGYSMFLRIFSAFTNSDLILVAFQYFFLQAAALGLNFTLYYFFSPDSLIRKCLLLAILLNPLFPLISNTISSDNLSLSLALIWFTLLLWIIYQPTRKVVVWHAIVLFFAFTIRFNAMFYPLISCLAFFISSANLKSKIKGVVLMIVLIGSFVIYNQEKYYQLCGTRQFAPFSGWQMANNALYSYRYVTASKHKKVPEKFEKLDSVVRDYFAKASKDTSNQIEKQRAFDRYMWVEESPLWIYFWQTFGGKEQSRDLKHWATAAPFYKEYATWIIIQYPVEFFSNVIVPHIHSWFFPPMYSLTMYNGGYDNIISPYITDWFNYKSIFIKTRLVDINILDGIYALYPWVSLVINFVFLFTIILFFIKRKQTNDYICKFFILFGFWWMINFGFNIFASQIELRYLLFPIHLMTIFSILVIGSLFKTVFK